ncbi:MAG: cytochrome-c oxidase, cbb3-type subunit I [Bdellovibrionales bacterium]|nr:cytochrome-c oxidase, cbb3-type subunit I [Bdellovibrionales bacterium]
MTAHEKPEQELPDLVRYDDQTVRNFTLATLVWAGVGFLVGLVVALQLAIPALNFGLPWLTFGRLRPLHTNAVIFAFAGNAIFAGIYYSMQRLLKTRAVDGLSKFHFWGWQLIIVSAALTLPFGFTTGKEYAELEWPIDIAIAVVWIAFGANMISMVRRRREPHLYVAIWFYLATFATIALLHVVNSVEIPVSFLKSYPVYAGVQDALVQWWYGHNAVAFFLTTPFLGLMYYFVPKVAKEPIYSYRLSVVHFWSLILIYIWAGPHHLLNTALPEWAQTVGMAFSVMLWIPSWGGMINGLFTVRQAWHRVREEPILRFFAAALIAYGMATFEGPLLSIKSVSALGHYTDWIIGHVHGGALGWNGFLSFGMVYFLVPKLWGKEMYRKSWINTHFWLATIGIVLYVVSMWVAGITQGMMWMAIDHASGKLVYPDFVETVLRIVPLYYVRALGGTMYLAGFVVMAVNVAKTIASAKTVPADETVRAPAIFKVGREWFQDQKPHRILEGLPVALLTLAFLGVLAGSLIELVPILTGAAYHDEVTWNAVNGAAGAIPRTYRPLEVAGRDIYVREGCYLCHSQMIRQLPFDVLRYGPASTPEESMWDHPFQWGSKRTGPDLARVGGKYPDSWHYRHMRDPRDVSPQSIMPTYPWLYRQTLDFAELPTKLRALRRVGVPYSDADVANAEADARTQSGEIAAKLASDGAPAGTETREIVALIAYLQTLGKMTPAPTKVGGN